MGAKGRGHCAQCQSQTSSVALNNLAKLYGSQGRDVEAEPLLKRAIAIPDTTAGLESPENASALNNLAALYPRQACRHFD